jgi:hemolysin III
MGAQRKRDRPRDPSYTLGEEIAHAVTHGLGLVLSIGGLAVLVVAASTRGDAWHVVGAAVFGATLVLLYAASTLYHSIQHPGRSGCSSSSTGPPSSC